MNNSRFITYPSTVEANTNHKVVLIDATVQELIELERFLQTSDKNFDVYLYEGPTGDLEWLNSVVDNDTLILINDVSKVKITPDSIRYQTGLLKHFEKIEQQTVDKIVESLL